MSQAVPTPLETEIGPQLIRLITKVEAKAKAQAMRLSAPSPIRSKGRYHNHDQPRPRDSAARRRVVSPNRTRPARARHDPGEAAAELAAQRTVTIAAATTAAVAARSRQRLAACHRFKFQGTTNRPALIRVRTSVSH